MISPVPHREQSSKVVFSFAKENTTFELCSLCGTGEIICLLFQ